MDPNEGYIRINIADGELEIKGDENFIRLYAEPISKIIDMVKPENIRPCCDEKSNGEK